jgi:hypothetical protein
MSGVWQALSDAADHYSGDECEDGFNIGMRDGFSEAVQLIDTLTGGDGEYRYCTNGDPDRHCPTPDHMIAKIVERFRASDILAAAPGESA